MDELLYAAANDAAAATSKGERTRARILESALELFRARGYEKTTMRAVAAAAGVSLGNAYYYFRSKEHLIQAFYALSHRQHLAVCGPILAAETTLEGRLRAVVRAKIETSMDYHRFAGVLFKTAADPESPLNPWSVASRPVRREATALFAEVVEGATTRIPPSLAGHLPNLLWTYQMGVLLFWIHDPSPTCRRTFRLIDGTVPLIARLTTLAALPPLRPLVRTAASLLDDLGRDEDGGSAGE